MRGISKGESCSSTQPIIQLFTRSGEFLVDPVSGSFKIEYLGDTGDTVEVKVASTPLDLADAPVGHKLGTGRFVIPFDTSVDTWEYGTHRAVCTFLMAVGGETFTQVIQFELLDPASYPNSADFVSYVSTRKLYDNKMFVKSVHSPVRLHPILQLVANQIEGLVERFFEPRYETFLYDGSGSPLLFLDEAIIAIDSIEVMARSAEGVLSVADTYSRGSFRVYNRHLDGKIATDDRHNPKLSLTNEFVEQLNTFHNSVWPQGRANLRINGVFGYTDPTSRAAGSGIGHTPLDLEAVMATLAHRHLEDPSMSSPTTWKPGMVKSFKTRQQKVEMFGASGSVEYTGGLLGDSALDTILQRFARPCRNTYIDARNALTGV